MDQNGNGDNGIQWKLIRPQKTFPTEAASCCFTMFHPLATMATMATMDPGQAAAVQLSRESSSSRFVCLVQMPAPTQDVSPSVKLS